MGSSTAQTNGAPEIKTSVPPAVDPKHQPPAQSPDLKLVPATPIEHVQTAYLNRDEWRGPLTLEQYLEREALLQSTDLSKDGRLTCWILTSESLPKNKDGSRPIFASCETFLVHGYVAKGGKVEQVQAHGVGSVYTRPEYRGKGYGGRMMADLGKRLETWQQLGDSINPFSALWSDIGGNFYSRYGWKVFPSNHIHLSSLDRAAYEAARASLPDVDDLAVSDLPHIPTIEYLEERLHRWSESKPDTIHVAIRPDMEHFQWHLAREEFIFQALSKPRPQIKGAIHRATGVALFWFANAKEQRLHILHTVVSPSIEKTKDAQAAMAALLLRAQRQAHDLEMAAGVEVWNPSDLVITSAQNLRKKEQEEIEIITRDKDHLCSLRWAAGGTDEIVWVANEQYAWC